jgi:methylenetetrahydrofolate reductase (NADPH)
MTALHDAITAAGKNWSIEVTPPGATKISKFADVLAEGTTVNVTFLPGTDPCDTVDVAERLRGEGLNPVPHIAARSLKTKDQLAEIVRDMTSRAKVDEVLVIGGGVDDPVGDFSDSMQVLDTGLLQDHGIGRIGVSGHPEGSPDIDESTLARALEWKNEFARKEGIDLYIETQFCFEAAPVIGWEERIRAAGNDLPIRVGIPGPATIKTLLRFAQISGIGPSMRLITKQARNVTKLLTVQSPHMLITGLSEAMAADTESRIRHFHYYPFGGFARTAKWAGAVASGDFKLEAKGGFSVNES